MKQEQKRITLSFSEKNEDVYDFLKEQPNIVDYVCRLVRDKLINNKKDLSGELKKVIKNYVESEIQKQLKGVKIEQSSKNQIEKVDEDVRALILSEED